MAKAIMDKKANKKYSRSKKRQELNKETEKWMSKNAKSFSSKKSSKVVKKVAKTISKKIGPIGAVLTAAEIAKGAVKVGKTLKAKKSCNERGGVYKKGFCIKGVQKAKRK